MKPRQRNPTRTRQVQRALTLIELMVVVVVAAVLLMVVAPSFRDLILNQRLKSIHAQFVTDMQAARAEAAARGVMVSVRVQPAGANGAMSCYILITDAVRELTKVPSNRCDCMQPAGSRCVAAGTVELRTVLVPASLGVRLVLPVAQVDYLAFDPITGGLVQATDEVGNPLGNDFIATSSIDNARQLQATVGRAGRTTVCRPAGSVFGEVACA